MQAERIVSSHAVRTHVLSVVVDESRLWDEAVRAAGPDTGNDYDVYKVEGSYPPARNGAGAGKAEITLVNFGNCMVCEDDVLSWGKEQHLRPAPPRVCLAVGEHYPRLHSILGVSPLALVSLDLCLLDGDQRVCVVWWNGSKREACLFWLSSCWGTGCWFAFVPEEDQAPVDNAELTHCAGVLQ